MNAAEQQLADLTTVINNAETVIDGATAFANGVPALIASAAAAAIANGATEEEIAPVSQLGVSLQAKADALAAALVANTTAAPTVAGQ